MKKVPLIRMRDEKDCGACALSMIAHYYGKKLPLPTVREAIKVDQYGANIYGLQDGARKFSLDSDAYEGCTDDVWNAIEDNSIKLPAIIRILNRGDSEHFCVAVRMKKGELLINDPDAGRIHMTKEMFNACFLGQVITFRPDECFFKENLRKGQFSKFTVMIFKQKKLLTVIGALSLLVTAIGVAGSFIFQYVIDKGLQNLGDFAFADEWIKKLMIFLFALGILYVFRFTVEMLRGKLLTTMSKNIDLPLMLGYYDHVVDLPMKFFETRKTGEITSRFNDAAQIRDTISNATLTIMIDAVMAGICGVVLYRMSVEMFAVALGIFMIHFLISILYIRPLDRVNRDVMEKNALFASSIKETIDGMETIKALRAENSVKEKTGNMFHDYLGSSIRSAMLSLSKDTIIEAVTSIGSLLILWVGVLKVIHGDITLGTLITFTSLLQYFISPVTSLLNLQNNIQTAVVAADRLNDILILEKEQTGNHTPKGGIESIRFDGVNYRYGNRELVIRDMNFNVKKGETIALVGESGCGKSTAVKLLTGMYTPESGDVYINGVSVNTLSISWLRGQTAYVSQTPSLFSGSIRDNLQLGLVEHDRPSDKKIQEVLKECGCEFVLDMPLGIDSILEENGINISGGQRQRLAIARAILQNPSLLILDESTSALDAVTECRIQRAIHKLLPDTTVVTVTHRLSTVENCDQILVIDHGSIIETGSHSELLLNDEKYADLWKQQNYSPLNQVA